MVNLNDSFYLDLLEKMNLIDETNRFSDLDSEMEIDMVNSILRADDIDNDWYKPSLFKLQNEYDENDVRYIGYYPMYNNKLVCDISSYIYGVLDSGVGEYKLVKRW